MDEAGPNVQSVNREFGRDAEVPEGKLIGQLLAILAHDFRNPLAALCSNLDYLKTVAGAASRDSVEAIDDGIVSCDGLSHLIHNLELLGQLLRREKPPTATPVRLGVVAAAAVENCRAAAQSHGLHLELDSAARDCRVQVEAPKVLAIRAVANLIRNGIQHAPPGSSVRLEVRDDEGRARVVVSDSGLPLGVNELDPFSAQGQIPSTRTSSQERYSRGLGLLCARIGATACGANVSGGPRPTGEGNQFELVFRSS